LKVSCRSKAGPAGKKLEEIQTQERTVIFYESPHRVLKTLEDIKEFWPGHTVVVRARIDQNV